MIPERLKLENFMCFSKIEVDFSSLKVVCLTGKNGSGKSSIIDAVTWALWEKARSHSDQLIKLGTNSMKVELEFIVGNVKYKVIRHYQKGALNNPRKPAKTVLELYYFDNKKKNWQPFSGKHLKDTQDKIGNLIKMDYDAFINSVYIRQGNVDSFLTKTPEERKSVLAEILGLGEYERLYHASKKKADDLEVKAKVIKEQINEGEIKQFSLKKLKDQKEALIISINNIQEQLSGLLKDKKGIESKNNQYNVLNEQKSLYSNIKNKYEDDIAQTKDYIDNLKGSIAHFKEMIALEHVINQKYENLSQLKDKLKDYDSKEYDYHKLKDRLIEYGSKQMIKRYGAEHEYKKISESLDEKLQQLESYRQVIEHSEEIQKNYIEYQDVKNKVANFDKFHLELCDLEVKIARLQNIIDKLKAEYQSRQGLLQTTIDEITHKLTMKEELQKQKDLLDTEIKQYDKYEAELERIREKGIDQREVVFDRTNKNTFLELELEKLKNKINQLQAVNKNINCPTCTGKVLNPDDIIRKFEFEIDNLMAQVESNDNDISISEDEIKFLRIAYKEKKKYLSKRSSLIFQLAELRTDLNNLELEEQKLEEYKLKYQELQDKIAQQDYAQEEQYQIKVLEERKKQLEDLLSDYENLVIRQKELEYIEKSYKELNEAREKVQIIESELPYFTMSKRALEKELNSSTTESQSEFANDAYAKLVELQYDLQTHINLREELANSQQIEYDYLTLQFAYQQLPFLEKSVAHLEESLNSHYAELAKIKEVIQDVNKKFEEYTDFSQNLEQLNETSAQKADELNVCNCQLAVINDRLKVVEEALEETKNKRKELDDINKDISHYIELANAFGKKGIQDIIIENSLPDIENETNKLLAKLTDNQMRISLKSTKSNKTGDINNRLDIYIADNQGTRSYELYSGGEAFRINFAVRIALSKLLAKSRGVKLQTLIIDDAFGTQDELGQEKLASIINLIKDDFDMILLVTHINEFVNLFPSRIELSKEAGDSIVKVVA